MAQWVLFWEANSKEVLDMLAVGNSEIKTAADILEIMSRSERNRELYEARQAELQDIMTGLEEARQEGKEEERKAIAKQLLLEGSEIDFVIKITKSSRDKVKAINEELDK